METGTKMYIYIRRSYKNPSCGILAKTDLVLVILKKSIQSIFFFFFKITETGELWAKQKILK